MRHINDTAGNNRGEDAEQMPPAGASATELGAALIVLLVCVAFEPSLSGPAAFTDIDDKDNFVEHRLVAAAAADGLSLRMLVAVWLPHYVVLGVWEPVATLLKVMLARLFGLGSALPFLRASVALHCANCLGAYALGCRALALLRAKGVTGLPRPLGEDHRPVCLAAILVGISPMCVEPVAWASGQPYVLAGSFALAHCFLHLRRYHPTADERARRARAPSANLVLLAYVAAALCKAAALTVFAVPALIDLLVWAHGPGRRLRLLRVGGGRTADLRPAASARRAEAAAAASAGSSPAPLAQVERFDDDRDDLDDDDGDDEDDPREQEEEEEEAELAPKSLRFLAAHRRRWPNGGHGPDELLLFELAEHIVLRHWRHILACALGMLCAVLATSGMHGRPLGLLERILRACHMLVAYPLCALSPTAHTTVRLHLPPRLDPISRRFGLPALCVLVATKGCTYAVSWYGDVARRTAIEGREAIALKKEGALAVAVLPPPFAFLTHVAVWLAYCALLLPTLGVLSWGRTGSHVAMVRADRYAYLPALLLGVPSLAGLLAILGRVLTPRAAKPPAEQRAEALVAARARALGALGAELRAYGLEAEGLEGKLGGLRAYMPRFGGSPAGAGVAAGEAVQGAPASAPAAAAAPTHVGAPAAAAPPPAQPASARSRQLSKALVPLLCALACAARVRQTRELAGAWASPERLYAHILSIGPKDAPMLEALGTVLMASEAPADHERAEGLLRDALQVAPESGNALNSLGLLLQHRGELVEAEAAFSRAIALAPRDGSAYVNLGSLLLEWQREPERAAELLATAVELLPRSAAALNAHAVALKGVGRTDEARAAYERALELRPNSAALHFNLALLYMERGFDTKLTLGEMRPARTRARELYTRTLELDPSHKSARQNLDYLNARTSRSRPRA